MALTEEQKRLRAGKVTAGFAPYLMAGKEDRIYQEWDRLVNDRFEEPDFDGMWNLHYGSVIEPIALDWHEKKTGQPLIRRGEVVTHPDLPHVSATLDAFRIEDEFVVDCKAWSSWQKVNYICSFLCPQIIVQKGCTRAKGGSLLLVHGGSEPVEYPLTWGAEYEASVWKRIEEFWWYVQNLTCPIEMPPIAADVICEKEIDFRESNSWATHASVWISNKSSANTFHAAEKELKSLMLPDIKRGYGHGVQCLRDNAGRLHIKEMK